MRALYALLGAGWFLIMIGLMVWKIITPSLPLLLIIPALISGALGVMFTGASKEGAGDA